MEFWNSCPGMVLWQTHPKQPTWCFFIKWIHACISFVYCIINSYLYIHFNNFFTPHFPLDGVNHLIRIASEPSSFFLVCLAPHSNSFRFSRLAVFEAPRAGSLIIRFHGNQQDNVGIPSAKRKREVTGIWTADLLGTRQVWRPLDHDAPPTWCLKTKTPRQKQTLWW